MTSNARLALGLLIACGTAGVASAAPPDPEAAKRLRQRGDDMSLENTDEAPQLALRFFDAVSGAPIPGASVELEGARSTTNGEGRVVFDFPSVRPDEDRKYALFTHDGYITSKVELHFMAGTIFLNRYSISRKLPPGRVRIVLDWGSDPGDLDAHLVKDGQYHISYRDTKQWEDKAGLDRDDQDGFGPETITINSLDLKGTYTFYVHDYTHRTQEGFSDMARSAARVAVFGNDQLLHQVIIPKGAGRAWKVIEIRSGEPRIVSTMVADVPGGSR